MFDLDYWPRLELLYELAQVSPNKPMRKLQFEALKYYPLKHKENKRAWLSIKTAFKCFDAFCPLSQKIKKGA